MTERAITAADSGITANQTWIDNMAANIANANTIGYKSTQVQFEDLVSQQLQGASAPQANGAGANPVEIGSGVTIGASAMNLSEGSLEQTGVPTDVAIKGDGYLVVSQAGQQMYTRNGSLTLDANGNLATQTGGLIQGWQANSNGVINSNAPLTGVKIPTGETIAPNPTTSFTVGGNLPEWSGIGTAPVQTSTLNAYDSQGTAIPVTLTFTGVSGTANAWTVAGTVTSPTGTTDNLWSTTNPPVVTFNAASGQISAVTIPAGGTGTSTTNTDGSISLGVGAMPAGFTFPSGDTWAFNLPAVGSASALTEFAGQSTFAISHQNGYASGTLNAYSIGADGTITGSFSNGATLNLGQIALASFSNPAGLLDQGFGAFVVSPNSGQAQVGTANTGGRGSLLGGQLEQSNVNLDTELTNLIQAQVAYDANTKPLNTEQQVLTTLEQLP